MKQNDTGEADARGRASASLSAIDIKGQFKLSGVRINLTTEQSSD